MAGYLNIETLGVPANSSGGWNMSTWPEHQDFRLTQLIIDHVEWAFVGSTAKSDESLMVGFGIWNPFLQ
jgi:hypothetical protein